MAAIPEKRVLPRVILDESSQVTVPAALVALGHRCERLVLIGDTRQLGPISCLGHSGDDESGIEQYRLERRSVFESLQRGHGLRAARLSVQYRMDERLCRYPSERFYEGALATDPSCARGEPPEPFPLPAHLLLRPGEGEEEEASSRWPGVVFVDTSDLEERWERPGQQSVCNELEAALVVEVLEAIRGHGAPPHEIGIVTPYRAQRDCLLEAIHGAAALGAGPWPWQSRSDPKRREEVVDDRPSTRR